MIEFQGILLLSRILLCVHCYWERNRLKLEVMEVLLERFFAGGSYHNNNNFGRLSGVIQNNNNNNSLAGRNLNGNNCNGNSTGCTGSSPLLFSIAYDDPDASCRTMASGLIAFFLDMFESGR
jgi:hypothetical protein